MSDKKIAMEYINSQIIKKMEQVHLCLDVLTYPTHTLPYNTYAQINNTVIDVMALYVVLESQCYSDDSCNDFECFKDTGFYSGLRYLRDRYKSLADKIIESKKQETLLTEFHQLSSRAVNVLKSVGVIRLCDLLKISDVDLLHIPNLGKKVQIELREFIKDGGYIRC
jgi:hypothetical protein